MASARAIVHRAYGDPERGLALDEVSPASPGRGEVLVDVHASTVSQHDRLRVQGQPYTSRVGAGLRRPRPQVLGTDFAGVVASVGPGGGRLRAGDEVFGWCRGALAEEAVSSAGQVTARPANLTAEQAAVVPTAGTTALRAVRDAGRTRPGAQVLVIGASGAVGTFAVQIAAALGASVTGVCSTTNTDLVRSIGAERTIDYTLAGLDRSAGRWDVVIDLAGGRALQDLRRLLAPTGTLVVAGWSATGWGARSRRRAAAGILSAGGRQRVRQLVPRRRRADLEDLRDLIEASRVTPVVSAHYPLAEVPTALRHFAPGHARGAVAITV